MYKYAMILKFTVPLKLFTAVNALKLSRDSAVEFDVAFQTCFSPTTRVTVTALVRAVQRIRQIGGT